MCIVIFHLKQKLEDNVFFSNSQWRVLHGFPVLQVLFDNAQLTVERGEKLAVIGPNGCGKSTLLRMLMNMQEASSGDISFGEYRVVPNYFEQNQAEALDLNKTVLQTVEEAAEDWRMNDIKALLGRCNFKAEMLDRKVAFLSGGEKARLSLCKFMVTPSTVLVLDEPTNHLDIPSKEMLEVTVFDPLSSSVFFLSRM